MAWRKAEGLSCILKGSIAKADIDLAGLLNSAEDRMWPYGLIECVGAERNEPRAFGASKDAAIDAVDPGVL
jgi:hypothetical protein